MKNALKFNFLAALLYALLFIMTLDNTIALRNLLIVTIAFVLFWQSKSLIFYTKKIASNFEIYSALKTLLFFTLFVFLHSIFLSIDMQWSINEWRSQLVYPVIYCFIGIILTIHLVDKKRLCLKTFLTSIFIVLFLHVIYIDLNSLDVIMHSEYTRAFRNPGLMLSPTTANYISISLLSFILAEYAYRFLQNKTFMRFSNGYLHFILFATLASIIFQSVRMGQLEAALLGFMFVFILYYGRSNPRKRNSIFMMIFLLIFSLPLVFSLATDNRWSRLVSTIEVSLDNNKSDYWINQEEPQPLDTSGEGTSASNYLRISWFYNGVIFFVDRPLGYGFGRHSFGRALNMNIDHYNKIPTGQTSHNGFIDLLLGVGIGIFIWLYFNYQIIRYCLRRIKKTPNFPTLLLLFFLLSFLLRFFLDANMRDHMFLQFMIIFGIILGSLYVTKES